MNKFYILIVCSLAMMLSGCLGGGGGGGSSAGAGGFSSASASSSSGGEVIVAGEQIVVINDGGGNIGTTAPNPEPATMVLFGSGLLGMALFRRRKNAKGEGMKKFMVILIFAGLILGLGGLAEAGISNLGFETGDFTGWTTYGFSQDLSAVSSGDAFATPFGSYMAVLGPVGAGSTAGPQTGQISQSFTIDDSSLSFWTALWTTDYSPYDIFSYSLYNDTDGLMIDSGSGDAGMINPSGSGVPPMTTGWMQAVIDTSSYIGDTATLTFEVGNTGDGDWNSWAYLDNGPGGVIPEPATLSLLGLGLLGLAGLRKKKA